MQNREWTTVREFEEIRFELFEGIAKITINRPRYYNAFTPDTTREMSEALVQCREMSEVRVVILTGEGDKAFCSGGDQNVKSFAGYVGKDGVPRLNILDVQRQIRSLPKPVIAMVNGYAIGGGHVLHVVCDLSSHLKQPGSVRPVQKWAVLMRDSDPHSWRDTLDRKRQGRSGSCVNNTVPGRPLKWA